MNIVINLSIINWYLILCIFMHNNRWKKNYNTHSILKADTGCEHKESSTLTTINFSMRKYVCDRSHLYTCIYAFKSVWCFYDV